jgi:hypothetical protein
MFTLTLALSFLESVAKSRKFTPQRHKGRKEEEKPILLLKTALSLFFYLSLRPSRLCGAMFFYSAILTLRERAGVRMGAGFQGNKMR